MVNLINDTERKALKELIENSVENTDQLLNRIENKVENLFQSKLRQNKTNYKILMENANDFIAIINQNFQFEEINKEIHRKKLGYKPNNLIGSSVLNYIHPDDFQAIEDVLKNGFNEGKATASFRFKNKQGNYLWIQSKGKVFTDSNDKQKAIIISRDVSKKKEMERKLRKSEREYRILINNIFDVLMKIDLTGKIHYVSPQIESDYGYNIKEVLGTRIFDYIHQNDIKRVFNKFKEVLKGNRTLSSEYRIRKKDGTYVWVLSKGRVVNEGDQNYVIGFMRNIDKTKKVNEKLKESEKRYRELFEGARDGFVMVDSEGRIKDANQAYCKMVGYSLEELKELEDFYQITPKKWHKWEKKEIWEKKLLTLGHSGEYEKEYIRKDGRIFPIEIQAYAVFDEDKNVKYLWGVVRDITERKKTQEKIIESERQYRLLAENVRDIIWVMDMDFNFKYVSPSVEDIRGFTVEEVMNQSLNKLFTPDSFELAQKTIREKLAPKKLKDPSYDAKTTLELEHTCKDGSTVWVEVKMILIRNDKGEPTGILGVSRDIDERKKIEDKLEKSRRKLRLFIDSSPDMFFMKDKNFQYTLINKTNAQFFESEKEDILGKTDFKFMSKEAAINCRRTDKLAMAQKKIVKSIELIDERIYETRKRPVIIDGKVTGVAGIIRDITEQNRIEQQLKDSRKKYHDIAEILPDIIYEINRSIEITYLNSIGYKKLGLTKENIENGVSFLDLVADKNRQNVNEMINKIFAGNYTEPLECYINSNTQNKEFYARIHSIPIYKNDKIIGIRGTISDISKIKESEEQLIHLNNLKSEILRRTSHELKTPLVSIKGFSSLLLDQYRNDLEKRAISMIEEIQKGCKRLEDLIKDILETAKLESGIPQVKKKEYNLSSLIKNTIDALQGLIKARKQSVELSLEEDLKVKVEKERFSEVLENILSNALKYTPPEGKIKIKSRNAKDNIIISVEDNGIGFTTDEKAQLFTQFGKIERYGAGYDLNVDGSGLGLYIAKKTAELHGGEIWMESEGRNKGSTFFISLPNPESD